MSGKKRYIELALVILLLWACQLYCQPPLQHQASLACKKKRHKAEDSVNQGLLFENNFTLTLHAQTATHTQHHHQQLFWSYTYPRRLISCRYLWARRKERVDTVKWWRSFYQLQPPLWGMIWVSDSSHQSCIPLCLTKKCDSPPPGTPFSEKLEPGWKGRRSVGGVKRRGGSVEKHKPKTQSAFLPNPCPEQGPLSPNNLLL